jgi:hypothetical protein
MAGKTQVINLRCTPADRERLRAVAARRGITASEVVRRLVQDEARRVGLEFGNGGGDRGKGAEGMAQNGQSS